MQAYLESTLIVDQNQARTQLELLGYKPGDNIYMRFFVPDGDPRHGTPAAARKSDKLNWEEVERYQNDGYGVYFVVNGGGHTDEDVQQGRALFWEWDDRPIEDQVLAWQELNLPEPSLQVETRKSVHNYLRTDLTKEQWIELQQDLLAYTQSDQQLKNPSRVLRLAGAWHIKPGCEPIRCDIIHQSDKVYTYEELRAAIPHRQQPVMPSRNYQPAIADDVPLYQCLTKSDRALIDQGTGQGSRNDSGAKLARNLIGTAARLNHLGIRFSDDPRQLFDEYCSRCSPPIAPKEAETIWKSAQKDNPTASLSDEALENCAKAWVRNQKLPGQGYSSGIGNDGRNGSSLLNKPKLSTVERFKADLLALANSDDDLERLVRVNELACTYRMPASEIRKALSKTEVATRTPKAQFFKLDEFLSLETEGIDYLIPGLLPRGETVLCVGLPKSGKTLLTIDAAFSVATGESKFLGETVQQGKVLVVSVDESAQSTKLKLMKRGFRARDAQSIAVMTQWDVSQMAELEAKLEDFQPDLVVIDSLRRITAGREISENSAEFADIIYQLKELLGRYGASSILVHHSNKSQDAVGVGKVRGSTAIAGACWGVWQLDHIVQTTDENGKPIKGKPKFDPSDPRRIFTAICRDADSQQLTIQFNPENHSYDVASLDGEAQQERKTQEQLILDLLTHHHPNGLSGREIMEALGLGRGIYTVLDRMVSRRTVTQRQSKIDARSMVYALPKKRDTHPPSPSLQLLTKFSETTVVEPKNNSQQIVNNESTFSQRSFDKKEAVDYLNPEQMDVSGDSQQLLPIGGGVCVETEKFTELNTTELSQPELEQHNAIAPILAEQTISILADEVIAPTTLEKPIQVGDRVKYIYQHSKRCGMVGVVRKIDGGIATLWLDYHKSLTKELRELESPLADLRLIE